MSFKAIDMQFAVTKSTETGMKQNQLMHKTVLDQTMIASGMEKSAETARTKSNKVEESLNHIIRDDDENGKNKFLQQEQRKQNKSKAKSAGHAQASGSSGHPYKGKHIDYSL